MPSNDDYVIHNTIIMPAGAYYAIGLNYGAYQNKFYNNIILTKGSVPCFSTTGIADDLKIVSDNNLLSKKWAGGKVKGGGGSLYENGRVLGTTKFVAGGD